MKKHRVVKPYPNIIHWGLMVILLIITIGSKNTIAQDTAAKRRVSLHMKNVSTVQLFEAIKKQTQLNFVFNTRDFNEVGLLTIDTNDEEIEILLKRLYEKYNIEFTFKQTTIIAKPKPTSPLIITGNVLDKETASPLPGVTIVIPGTTLGTSTDSNGKYQITIPSNIKQLRFSFIGYESIEVEINGQQEINVDLVPCKEELNEVVVTGIFTKARESYTGAATSISAKEIKSFKGQNLISTLKNIDPSIHIMDNNINGSNPNILPQINMRGNSSLPMNVKEFNEGNNNNINTPLIIMDGFEISLEKLMDYNDEEIESIQILKDASATAIYGSRGANGVVVIVSKEPQTGKLRVNATIGMNLEIPDLTSYNLLNAAEKLELEKRIGLYNNSFPNRDVLLKTQYNERYKDILEGTDTYWLSKPLHVGIGEKYTLRLEGGSEEFRWGISLGYNNVTGVMKGSERNNFNGAIILSYRYKNILFKNQTNLGLNKAQESKYGNFNDYVQMNPYFRPYDENGKIVKDFFDIGKNIWDKIPNPLYNVQVTTKDENKYTEWINNFSIEWRIREALKIRGQIGISKKTRESDYFKSPNHTDFSSSEYNDDGFFRKGYYRYGTGEDTNYDGNVTLSYSNTFTDKHSLYIGFDYSIAQHKLYNYSFELEGFTNDELDFIGNARQYKENGKPSANEDHSRRIGFTMNVNYTYDNRYYADFSARIDGSSQFGTNNKFAPFWSAGIGWNVHREKFMANNQYINTLRLKLSYGQTGSQQFEAYQAMSTYSYYTDKKYLNWSGAKLRGLGNKDLKWQVTDQINIGTEIALFRNRLNFAFDYYNKTTSNLFSNMDIPLATGFKSYVANIGKIKNSGFESSLGGYIIRNENISWMLTGKITYNKNKIIKLSQAILEQNEIYKLEDVDISTLFYEGHAQNSIYAVRSLGIDPSTGEEIFLDKNGNITDTWHPSDKVYLGVNEPLYRGNLNTMFTWKNLSINLSFGYHWGGKLYNQTLVDKVEVLRENISSQNLDKRVLKARWTNPGDVTFFKKISETYNETATRATSRFVMRDNVFTLQSASLQYRLNFDWLKKRNIDVINLGVDMSDIFYLSSIKYERGIYYPFARRIGFSLSLMF